MIAKKLFILVLEIKIIFRRIKILLIFWIFGLENSFNLLSIFFFKYPDICVPDISKTNKVIILKQTSKVAHMFYV